MFRRKTRETFPRSGEPWALAEERRLLQLFARPRRVWWCGRYRTTAMYYVASVLGRSPAACVDKRGELRRCQRRLNQPSPPSV